MSGNKLTNRIKIANRIENPLSLIKDSEFYQSRNGLSFKFESKRATELDENLKEWCFRLVETNMKKIYKSSKGGWNERKKREEMFEQSAYYIIAYDLGANNKPAGFCHFRFDMDYDFEVVYCYELQIEPQMQKSGLGNFIMQILEKLSEKLKLDKVVLTCSKFNSIGQKFFREKMRYEVDESDPNEENPKADYYILSKIFWENILGKK